jgi:hypothetical protein
MKTVFAGQDFRSENQVCLLALTEADYSVNSKHEDHAQTSRCPSSVRVAPASWILVRSFGHVEGQNIILPIA